MIDLTASYEEVLFGPNMKYEFFSQLFLQHQEFIYSTAGQGESSASGIKNT